MNLQVFDFFGPSEIKTHIKNYKYLYIPFRRKERKILTFDNTSCLFHEGVVPPGKAEYL